MNLFIQRNNEWLSSRRLVAPKNAFLTTPVTEKGSVTDKPRKPELNVSNAQKVPTPLAPKQRFSKVPVKLCLCTSDLLIPK